MTERSIIYMNDIVAAIEFRIGDWRQDSAGAPSDGQLIAALGALKGSEPVQKMHELPASNFTLHRSTGERPCGHCEGCDPHCSVCEGVGTLP